MALAAVVVFIGCGSGTTSSEPGSPASAAASAASTTSTSTATASDQGPAPDPAPAPAPAPAPGHTIARAAVERLDVYSTPGGDGPVGHRLDNPNAEGAPVVLLVTGTEAAGMLPVLVPVRPNGTTGWVRATDVTLETTDYRITVALGAHRLTVHRGDELTVDEPVGLGVQATPTPPGTYFVTELIQPPDPSGPYGPFAFGLSGFSDILTEFGGGDGSLGIHGTDDPSTLGTDVSNGCIRLDNDTITLLAGMLPLGTPVEIVA